MKEDSTFSKVVLPEPVPPEIKMFSFARTAALKNVARPAVSVPNPTRSSAVNGSTANLRMVSTGPSMERGGMMALTREPSGSRASTIGLDSSTRRPNGVTILSMTWRMWSASRNLMSVSSSLPNRSQ